MNVMFIRECGCLQEYDMAKGKKVIIAVILLAAFIELFFIINNPNFAVKQFLGVPYNPFVIYFYLTLLTALGVFIFK